jgi:uncharacterized protein
MDKLYTERTIKTFSGIYVDVFEPKPEMFVIKDIAHGLSMMPRWGGHYPWFLSVAEHSRSVAYETDGDKLEALMHDASEAYLMDIPKPIKKNMPEYKAIEDGVMMVIAEKFGFQYPLSEETKKADKFELEEEWKRRNIDKPELINVFYPMHNFKFEKEMFLADFRTYTKNRFAK